jgi:hypothetical protein
MTDPDRNRWNVARSEVVARWRRVLERVEARDEGGTLALSTEMDEFCDESIAERAGAARPGGVGRTAGPAVGAPPGETAPMCHFCRGFIQHGGCAGLTQEFNRAVLDGDWDEARSLAEGYISRLEQMDFSR